MSLSLSSSSSSSPHVKGCLCDSCHYVLDSGSTTTSVTIFAQPPVLSGDALAAAKRSLIAVPSGSISVRRVPRKKGKKGKGQNSKTVSKTYFQNGGRPGIFKSIRLPTITTMMNFNTSFITTSTTIPTYGALFFRLSYFDNYTEFTSLFDQYMIEEVEVWIENSKTGAVVTQSAFVTCVDQDDANTPSSYNSVADRVNSLQSDNLAAHYHRFVPHFAVACYSGTFVSFANSPPGWIDSASPDVQHYGLKGASVATTDSVMVYQLFCRGRVSFRATGL